MPRIDLGQRLKQRVGVSIIICTRNRAVSLDRLLHSATGLEIPADLSWEMVIVDNGSTDDTAAIIESYSGRLPIRREHEARAGLSFARNLGVAVARGSYVIWTDDDVTLDRGWLAAYWGAFQRHPEAAIFGGRINPVLEAPSPAWIAPNRGHLRHLFAERMLSGDDHRIDPEEGEYPYGANFALRAIEQKHLVYNVALGASPMFNRLGEEEQMLDVLLRQGAEGWWIPSASVDHHIPPQRQTLEYVSKYSRAGGETWVYRAETESSEGIRPIGAWRLFGVPIPVLMRLTADYLRYRWYGLIGKPERSIPAFCSYSYFSGAAHYLARTRKGA